MWTSATVLKSIILFCHQQSRFSTIEPLSFIVIRMKNKTRKLEKISSKGLMDYHFIIFVFFLDIYLTFNLLNISSKVLICKSICSILLLLSLLTPPDARSEDFIVHNIEGPPMSTTDQQLSAGHSIFCTHTDIYIPYNR
jgi:hypothetical protein